MYNENNTHPIHREKCNLRIKQEKKFPGENLITVVIGLVYNVRLLISSFTWEDILYLQLYSEY